MQVSIIERLAEVPAADWNRLRGPDINPFLRHEYLAGLERHGCVGEHWGWLPKHLIARDAGGRLVGGVPLYLKFNSYGEFVFDWAWADAWQRAGGRYYPKLVSAVPYTPVTGPRLLIAPDCEAVAVGRALADRALELAQELNVSSLHWLFPPQEQTALLQGLGLFRRKGTQFHWHNAGYRDFDDYLERFSAQKRKKLKRERRRVREEGISIEVLDGYSAREEHWAQFQRFYEDTFHRHGGHATLTEPFFRQLAQQMPEAIVLVLARHQGRYVAAAFNLRGGEALYGRHWGCAEEFHSLHFEACYYTGIEFCIREGLARFEPGAQGEHKVARGFEPVATWSAHWVANEAFAAVLGRYVDQEEELVGEYMKELAEHLPFKPEHK